MANKNVWFGASKSGRVAVLIRDNEHSPWVQIDSCSDENAVRSLGQIYDLDDPAVRRDLISEDTGEDWGSDAPINPPSN